MKKYLFIGIIFAIVGWTGGILLQNKFSLEEIHQPISKDVKHLEMNVHNVEVIFKNGYRSQIDTVMSNKVDNLKLVQKGNTLYIKNSNKFNPYNIEFRNNKSQINKISVTVNPKEINSINLNSSIYFKKSKKFKVNHFLIGHYEQK